MLEMVIIVVSLLPIVLIKRIKIIAVPRYSFLLILIVEILLVLLNKYYKLKGLFLPSFFLVNFFLYVISNSMEYEENYLFRQVGSDQHSWGNGLRNILLGTFFIGLRNIILAVSFEILSSLVSLLPLPEELISFLRSFLSLEGVLTMCLFLFEWLLFVIQISLKQLLLLVVFIIGLGLFSLKWWVIISILVSMVGLAFSKEFITCFLITKFSEKEQIFYKFIIPYASLIFYVSLVFVKDVLPEDRAFTFFKIMDTLTFSSTKTTPPSFFIKAFFDSMLEIIAFYIIWITLKNKLLKKISIFVPAFFIEMNKVEDKAGKLLKDVLKKDHKGKSD